LIKVCVCNQKGGVGKSITSINLAAAMALKGSRILVVDFDPQGNSTTGLGVEASEVALTIGEAMVDNVPLRDIIIETSTNGVYVAPANDHLGVARERISIQPIRREAYLSRILDPPENNQYDYCFIDCGPSLDMLTINAINAADYYIIPCEVSRAALDGVDKLLSTITTVKCQDNIPDICRILLTKYDARNTVSIDWMRRALEPYQDMTFKTFIRKSEPVNQAYIAGRTVFEFNPSSTGAKDYGALAQEFIFWRPVEIKNNKKKAAKS
jgi:chromosome partitioning protein